MADLIRNMFYYDLDEDLYFAIHGDIRGEGGESDEDEDELEDINDVEDVEDELEDINDDEEEQGQVSNGAVLRRAQIVNAGAPPQEQLSQDADFQTQDQVVTRTRVGFGEVGVPEPQPRNVETEESVCSICFEPWTNSGSHRLISIKCGHLFGESCILKWITQRSREGAVKCPECNHPTKRRDVRRLWSKSVVVLDASEREQAMAKAKIEQETRIRCEQELANSRLAYEMLRVEMGKLQKKHDRQRSYKQKYRKQLKRTKLGNTNQEISRLFTYKSSKTVDFSSLLPVHTTQYLSYNKDEEMIVCTRQGRGIHGIAKISMRDFSNNLDNVISVHKESIRDLQVFTGEYPHNKSLILTASMDKTVKITSAKSNQIVLTYDLKQPVWSCCWSNSNPYSIYCATKSNVSTIITMDIRQTNNYISSFSNPKLLGNSPIHSMTHINSTHSQQNEGLLCGNLEGAFIFNINSRTPCGAQKNDGPSSASQDSTSCDRSFDYESERTRKSLLRLPGSSCSGVSFDPVSRHWMASYKFLGKPHTQHVRGNIDIDNQNNNMVLNSEFTVMGGAPPSCMSRSSIFSRRDGSVHMASGSVGTVHLWYGNLECALNLSNLSQTSADQLPVGDEVVEKMILPIEGNHRELRNHMIKDTKHITFGQDEYLAALSDKELELYKWTESRLTEESDSEDSDSTIQND